MDICINGQSERRLYERATSTPTTVTLATDTDTIHFTLADKADNIIMNKVDSN